MCRSTNSKEAFISMKKLLYKIWNKLPIRFVWPYLTQKPVDLHGKIQVERFVGSGGGEQSYFIYLPNGYESGNLRYPTLYHLHGAGMKQSFVELDCNRTAAKMEKAVSAGVCEPMIIVCAFDPGGKTMWCDSFDGKLQSYTSFTHELVPYIDASYRTVAESSGRAIQGFRWAVLAPR